VHAAEAALHMGRATPRAQQGRRVEEIGKPFRGVASAPLQHGL